MIRNTFLKKILINTVFKGATLINKCTKKDDKLILFYSDCNFIDNNKYLYDYLIKNNLNVKYKIVCACKDYKKYLSKSPTNVEFISPIAGVYRFLHSAHIFYSFGKLPIVPTNDQIVIQLWHGTPFKGFAKNQVKTANKNLQFYTHVYAASEYFVPIVEEEFQVNTDKVIICGHPRTDILYERTLKYDFSSFNKVIFWLPTFRKSNDLGMADGNQNTIIPTVNESDLKELESLLKKLNIKLIIKLHPRQNVDDVDYNSSTYLDFMTNDTFEQKGYDLYALLRHADALITDYSSVFYDFLLLNRPIGFTEDDVEEYSNSRGFVVDANTFRPGKKIRNYNDLKDFIKEVSKNEDFYKNERMCINDIVNHYQDGKNCERTLKISKISI